MPYEPYPIDTDPVDLQEEAYAILRSYWPDWEPNAGNLDTVMLQTVSRIAADLRDIAANVPPYIFRRFGVEMLGIDAVEAAPAQAQLSVHISHSDGFTVPAGTLFFIRNNDGEDMGFVPSADTVIPPGSNTAIVNVGAVVAGADGNDVSVGAAAGLGDALAYVDVVTLYAVPVNGEDEETIEEYESRLREELTLLTPRPILPKDFAILSLRVPGVARAIAIDLYNPADGTTNNTKMVTVIPIDINGEPMSAPVKAEIKNMLEDMREVNFVVNVADPSYTVIDVTYTVLAQIGWTAPDVVASVNQNLAGYFNPFQWGTPETGGLADDPELAAQWVPKKTINHYEVANIINDSPGVDLVQALTIEGSAGLTVTLTGAAPLTRPGVFAGTVNLP